MRDAGRSQGRAFALIGAVVHGEVLDGWVLAGAAVMFAGNYNGVRRETRR